MKWIATIFGLLTGLTVAGFAFLGAMILVQTFKATPTLNGDEQ